jgi:hypothetical protein
MTESYKCATCGKVHEGLPMSFAAGSPDMYFNMNRDDRDARCVHGSDQYIIDQKWFFIRGCLEIPIVGSNKPFLWGLWASVREDTFDDIANYWELKDRETCRGPYKGRLANSLAEYPETLNLKLKIILQPVGTRPLFMIEEADHPLAMEQGSGITITRAHELASLIMHRRPRRICAFKLEHFSFPIN